MTTEEFNSKWKKYIEPHFEDQGMMINDSQVISYLDTEFTKLENDGVEFQYSQIKLKFGSPCIYVEGEIEKDLLQEWYHHIQKLLKVR